MRLQAPGREWAAFRALQFAFFTTTLLLDEDESIAAALRGVEGIDVDAAIAAIDTPAVEEAYQRDRAEARSAAGSPTQLQDKHATSDGPVRYTAPSLVFEHAGRRLEAGGWQTIEAYDVIVANLIPDGERRGVPDDPLELLAAFPGGLTTQEVAQLLTRGNDAPDRVEAEVAMLRLVTDGAAGQERHERRSGSLHGSVARVRAGRPVSRGRRLADDRGVRRDRREPDPGRRAP